MHERLNLEQLRKQAKERLRERRAAGETVTLSQVHYDLAGEHGFPSWPKLRAYLEPVTPTIQGSAAETAARAAVLAYLAAPRMRPQPVKQARSSWGDTPPRPGVSRTGPFFATDQETVEVLKVREILGRYFFVVRFTSDGFHTLSGRMSLEGVFRVDPVMPDGWRASGAPQRVDGVRERSRPWVNLSCSSGAGVFYAAGKVHTAGENIVGVRLRGPDGTELEADTDGGWAIFFSGLRLDWPFTVELLDPSGEIVETHQVPLPRLNRETE